MTQRESDYEIEVFEAILEDYERALARRKAAKVEQEEGE